MWCERCGRDTTVRRHAVDEFTGFLCSDCRVVWDRFTSA
ncbi:small CPxCG-related zinc finger protein [Haloferax gibbonsii]|uniref:Small CPxCG-related zinc finger protein n=1 Tax=Haloferax gibbonsii TaxID=35746 RepID=A0A871BE37_HALGI|nr:small CPxCG-related zinc finger protein [Haloferax gibbonsii]